MKRKVMKRLTAPERFKNLEKQFDKHPDWTVTQHQKNIKGTEYAMSQQSVNIIIRAKQQGFNHALIKRIQKVEGIKPSNKKRIINQIKQYDGKRQQSKIVTIRKRLFNRDYQPIFEESW